MGLASNEAGRSPGDERILPELVEAELKVRDGVRGTLAGLDAFEAVLRILGGEVDMLHTPLLV
jgi:hypothetical protein